MMKDRLDQFQRQLEFFLEHQTALQQSVDNSNKQFEQVIKLLQSETDEESIEQCTEQSTSNVSITAPDSVALIPHDVTPVAVTPVTVTQSIPLQLTSDDILSSATKEPSESAVVKDSRLNHYVTQEVTGQGINENLVELVQKSVCCNLNHDILDNLKKQCLRPANCPFLVAPRVNPEIWNLMNVSSRNKDIVLRKTQENLINAMIPLVEAVDMAVSNNLPDLANKLKDSLQLLGHSTMDLNNQRKDSIRPDLPLKAKVLTKKDKPVSTLLFGDDIEAEIKKAESNAKLEEAIKHQPSTSTSRQTAPQTRFHPYSNPQTSSSRKKFTPRFQQKVKSFLGNFGARGKNYKQGQQPASQQQNRASQPYKKMTSSRKN